MRSIIQKNYLTLFLVALTTAFLSLSAPAFAKGDVNVDSSALAIKGYDTVAYFAEGKPRKGNAQFSHKHQGNTWIFASKKNLDTFVKNPNAYIPQYGGFCAFAASRNAIAPVDPEAWTIKNNKLYLNFSKTVRETWSEDVNNNIVNANKNWPKLSLKVKTR